MKEEDYMGMLDYITPPTHNNNSNVVHDQHSAVSIMNFFETATNGYVFKIFCNGISDIFIF